MVVHSASGSYECMGRRNDSRSCDQGKIKRELIDGSLIAYFESEGYDSNAAHRELVQAAQARLAEAQQLRKQAEREVTKATAWLDNITADYRDGKIDGGAWSKLTAQAESQRDAAEAQAERLRRRELAAVPPADEQLAELRATAQPIVLRGPAREHDHRDLRVDPLGEAVGGPHPAAELEARGIREHHI